MKLKYFLLILFSTCWISKSFSQYDSIVRQMQKQFDTFKIEIEQEHNQFKTNNDSVFSGFLKESWESFNVFFKSTPELKPKPTLQPIAPVPPENKPLPDKTPKISDTLRTGFVYDTTMYDLVIQPPKQQPEFEKWGVAPVPVEFYGNSPLLVLPANLPSVSKLTGSEIANYFDETVKSQELGGLIEQLTEIKKKLLLNDWGFFKLSETAAQKIYNKSSDQILLTWVILLKSGFNVKVGYNEEAVFLMVQCIHEMYNSWYLTINNTEFYIIGGTEKTASFSKLTVHTVNYPGNKAFSLKLDNLPEFEKKIISKELIFKNKKFTVRQNFNLIKFFEEYPLCNLEVHLSTPLSIEAAQSIDSVLTPVISGLSTQQKVAVLLGFVQNVFAYKIDKEQFGHEKFFFPDELIYYPYSDCEDRAAFFAWLVSHFTNLKCIGLEFPNHVSTAVLFPSETRGAKFTFDGQKYTVCDPTYLNASIGYLPEDCQKTQPKIITLDKK